MPDKMHTNGTDPHEDPVSGRLKGLPPVKASPDFEARLRWRLSDVEPAGERPGLWERLFPPRRMPAFGLSLIALVIVGFISYVMFRQPGMTPLGGGEISPPAQTGGRSAPANPPLLRQGEAPAPPGELRPGRAQSKEGVNERGAAAGGRVSAQSSGSEERRTEPAAGGEEPVGAPLPTETQRERDKSRNDKSLDLRQEVAPALKDETAPASESAPASQGEVNSLKQKSEAGENAVQSGKTQLQQMYIQEESKTGPNSPQLKKAQGLPLAAPKSYSPSSYAAPPQPVDALRKADSAVTGMADSAALRDSLRLDSLKRAHELRQLRQRRPRGKKPAGG